MVVNISRPDTESQSILTFDGKCKRFWANSQMNKEGEEGMKTKHTRVICEAVKTIFFRVTVKQNHFTTE